jgi:hypothetical protein
LLPPLLLPDPQAVIETTKDSAAIKVNAFLNFMTITPPNFKDVTRKRFQKIPETMTPPQHLPGIV